MKNDKTLKRWFRIYNKRYFDGVLPNALVFWEPSFVTGDDVGECCEYKPGEFLIRIDPSIKFSPHLTRLVLLHECSHLHLWPLNGHGKRFQAEMLRLAALGAFKNLW